MIIPLKGHYVPRRFNLRTQLGQADFISFYISKGWWRCGMAPRIGHLGAEGSFPSNKSNNNYYYYYFIIYHD